jgi:hypothetical protein
MKGKYTVIIVKGYNSKDEQGRIYDLVTVQIIESDVAKAIERSKLMLRGTSEERKHYMVSDIIEKFKE